MSVPTPSVDSAVINPAPALEELTVYLDGTSVNDLGIKASLKGEEDPSSFSHKKESLPKED